MTFFRIIGLPQNFLSDGGPCYTSDEFDEFCMSNNLNHIRSSLGHPRLNGLSKAHFASARNLLKKCDTFKEFESKDSAQDSALGQMRYGYRNLPDQQVFQSHCRRRQPPHPSSKIAVS